MKSITDTVMMLRPKNFGSNPETQEDNKFQDAAKDEDAKAISTKALKEFDSMVETLRKNDIEVVVIEDTDLPMKPDAIFPNNWFTTHLNNTICTYPMMSELRRLERREDIVDQLTALRSYKKHYGFEYHEAADQYLEGTGSMILDRENKIVYAGLSHRTEIQILEKFAVLYGYEKVVFHSTDQDNNPIYHTNVLMEVGYSLAILCTASIKSPEEKKIVLDSLARTGKELVDISFEQMNQFAGNMLEVKSKLGERYLIMSTTAYKSLTENQLDIITKHDKILHIDIPTIEKYGGGSVRCMMAEIF